MGARYGKTFVNRRLWCENDYDPYDDSICVVINKSTDNHHDISSLLTLYLITDSGYLHGIEVLSKLEDR